MDSNYTPLELPSKCILYKDVDPKEVGIRTLKGKDQMILAETSYENYEKSINRLLNNVLCGVRAEELTGGDRLHALLWLVINSRKKTLTIQSTCVECFREIEVPVDLTDLDVQELPDEYSEPYEEKLTKGTIKLKLLRAVDEKAIADYENTGKNPFLYRLAKSIVSEKNVFDLMDDISEMDSIDVDIIRAFQDKFFHGPILKYEYTCDGERGCGGTGHVPVPFRLEMLLPIGEELGRVVRDAVPVDVPTEHAS